MDILFPPVKITAIFFLLPSQVNPFGFCFSSLQSKEAKVEPINAPPTPSPPSDDTELSGEPVPEGTAETVNLSVSLHSIPEQGKSLLRLHTQWSSVKRLLCAQPGGCMPHGTSHLTFPSALRGRNCNHPRFIDKMGKSSHREKGGHLAEALWLVNGRVAFELGYLKF